MKSIARWAIAVVMVGMFVLIMAGQTQNDAVVAQGRKPVMMYRFYNGTDGLTYVEQVPVTFNEKDVASLMTAAGSTITRTKPNGAPGEDFSGPYHAAGRQYVFNLSGTERVNFSGGGTITLVPGDIEIVEDVPPGKGHRELNTGPEDRVTLHVPTADPTAVIGPLAK